MNKKLFGDFITWLKKPNPETTLVKLWQKKAWIAIELDNTNFIEGLKKDKSSDPKKAVDCSKWENSDSPK